MGRYLDLLRSSLRTSGASADEGAKTDEMVQEPTSVSFVSPALGRANEMCYGEQSSTGRLSNDEHLEQVPDKTDKSTVREPFVGFGSAAPVGAASADDGCGAVHRQAETLADYFAVLNEPKLWPTRMRPPRPPRTNSPSARAAMWSAWWDAVARQRMRLGLTSETS